jgi:type II secretory pathway pseudopilin PulG
MSRRSLIRRTRARLDGERGFTIVETIIAMVVIFGSLTALMYTATSGFRYIALARERQAATGAATRLMEQLHALSIETMTKGMKTSDLAGDPKIKTPADCGDGAYHFLACAGEKIVHSVDTATVTPLVPHTGTLTAPEYPTNYTWATYITNSNPASDPYRLTAIVSWSGGSISGAAKFIQLQSLWTSPKGCAATAVIHPFAGPCQPYFTGTATVAQGTVQISGTIDGSNITTSPALLLPSAETRAAVEQVSQMQGNLLQAGVRTTTQDCGVNGASSAADGNPTTSSPPYDPASPATPPKALVPDYCALTVLGSTGAPLTISNVNGSNVDSGATVATDSASATSKCPTASSPWPAFQADSLPCSWAQAVRGHIVSGSLNVTKTLVVGSGSVTAGAVTMAQFGETGTSTLDSWSDRIVPSGTVGRLDLASVRNLGTQDLVGIPAKFLEPDSGTNDILDATSRIALVNLQTCTGSNYLIRVTNYSATASASAGLSATAPSAGVTTGTTVKFWDGTACRTYTGAVGATSLNNATAQQPTVGGFTLVRSIKNSGKTGTMTYKVSSTVETPGSYVQFGGATTSRAPAAPSTTITSAISTINAPVQGLLHVTLTYQPPTGSAVTVFDLTLTIDLGPTSVRSQYSPAPTGG